MNRERLLKDLTSGDVQSRAAAARALQEWRDDAVLAALVGALGDEDFEVQDAAVESLQLNGDERTVLMLVPLLRSDDPGVRNNARGILERIAASAPEVIFELARDPDARMRNFACCIMGSMRASEAAAILLKLLDDPDQNVQDAAVVALGNLRSPDAVEPLSRLLENGHPWLRFSALDALGKIGGPGAVRALILALRMSDADVRLALIDSLSRLAAADAVDPLVALLVQEPELRLEILRVLVGPLKAAVLGRERGAELQPLVRSLREELLADRLPTGRVAGALDVLARQGSAEDAPAVLKALGSPDPGVRAAAARAAAAIRISEAVPVLRRLAGEAAPSLAADVHAALARLAER